MKCPLTELLAPYEFLCIGSLPFPDEARALNFVLRNEHVVPFWPELPRSASSELMLARSDRAARSSWNGYSKEEAAGLYALREALEAGVFRPSLLKCQVMGPCSYLLFGDPQLENLKTSLGSAIESCVRQIEWQCDFLQAVPASERTPLFFLLDEPGLVNWPNFSDEDRQALEEFYSYLYVTVAERGAYLGIHTCSGFSFDFFRFPFDLLSFDVLHHGLEQLFGPENAEQWRGALRPGFILAPGVYQSAPDENFADEVALGKERAHLISDYLSDLGLPEFRSQEQLIFSSTCGHAFSRLEWLEALYGSS